MAGSDEEVGHAETLIDELRRELKIILEQVNSLTILVQGISPEAELASALEQELKKKLELQEATLAVQQIQINNLRDCLRLRESDKLDFPEVEKKIDASSGSDSRLSARWIEKEVA